MDLLDLYDRASTWAASKVAGAADQLDASTPCDEWDVRTLMNHMVSVQSIFQGAARGEPGGPPTDGPPELIGDDPVGAYEQARQATIDAFREEGALERGGSTFGIGFVDQLVHGWDLAKATGQDATMPDGLAEAAFGLIDGRLPTDGSTPFFKKAIPVPADAGAQEKLLGLGGRNPN